MGGVAMFKGQDITAMAGPNAAMLSSLAANSPREIWVAPAAGGVELTFDFGSVVPLDSIYIGNTNAVDGDTWTLHKVTSMGGGSPSLQVAAKAFRLPGAADRSASVALLAAPFSARWVKLTIATTAAAPFEIGVFAAGLRFEHPYAWGAGRQPIDLSTVTQLSDGGFGIDAAAMKAAFKWKFIDLTDAQREEMWSFVMDRGIRRPFVLAEDVESAPMRASQLHYCKFDRLEPYERQNPSDTIWALSAEQWL